MKDEHKATHIIREFKSKDCEFLFRASDGMMLGFRDKVTVIMGENPNKRESRVFFDNEHASRYIRERVPEDDLDGINPIIDVVNGEGLIITVGDEYKIPGGSSITGIGGKFQ